MHLGEPDDHTLMQVRADALYTYDPRGRMLLSNEPRVAARRPAPRVYLGTSRQGVILRVHAAVPEPVAERIAALVRAAAAGDDATLHAAISAELEHDAPVVDSYAGPAFRFPDDIAPPAGVTPVTLAKREVARAGFAWLAEEIADWQPCYAVVEHGAAVSVCCTSRLGERVAEAGVATLPAARGRGYAAAVTAAWALAVRAGGRVPVYSTEWSNAASRGVARRLGLLEIGSDASWA